MTKSKEVIAKIKESPIPRVRMGLIPGQNVRAKFPVDRDVVADGVEIVWKLEDYDGFDPARLQLVGSVKGVPTILMNLSTMRGSTSEKPKWNQLSYEEKFRVIVRGLEILFTCYD